jgi:hypothetical protein
VSVLGRLKGKDEGCADAAKSEVGQVCPVYSRRMHIPQS